MRHLLSIVFLTSMLAACGGDKDEGSGAPDAVTGAFNTAPAEFQYDLESNDSPRFSTGTTLEITEGNGKVANGQASYIIPVELPPAVNNLAPDLSLNYNSGNRRSGHVGLGWSIGGLSSIYRCSANYATDGVEAQKSNPQYSVGDRLCMDGQRLVVVGAEGPSSDAEYWASGVIYATERESFSKIEPLDDHRAFRVYLQNGLIRYYGRNDDAQNSRVYRAGDEGGAIRIWSLDRVEDRYGNAYSIYYEYDGATGEHRVRYIQLTPDAQVRFTYSERSADQQLLYDAGSANRITHQLDAITTYIEAANGPSGGTPVRRYQLRYKTSPATGRLLVDTITECGLGSAGFEVCAKPLQFEWQAGEAGFEAEGRALLSCDGSALHATYLADINHDGINDVLTSRESVFPASGVKYVDWYLFTGTEQGCYDPQPWFRQELNRLSVEYIKPLKNKNGVRFLGSVRVLLANNRDAYYAGGLLIPDFASRTMTLDVIPGTTLLPNGVRTFMAKSGNIEVLDLNNDGLEDFWFADHAFLQNPANGGFRYGPDDNYVRAPHPNSGSIAIDVNSDGLQDLVSVVDNQGDGGALTVFSMNKGGRALNITRGSFSSSETEAYSAGMISHGDLNVYFMSLFNSQKYPSPVFNAYGDFNGDGIKDIAYHRGQTWWVRLGTGTGFSNSINTGATAANLKNQYFFAFDYNKDGKDDLLAQQDAGAGDFVWRVLTSRIEGDRVVFDVGSIDPFHGQSPLTKVQNPVEAGSLFRGDFNNDGVMDFYRSGVIGLWNHVNPAQVYYGRMQAPDLLVNVRDGFGKSIGFEYSTLTSAEHAGEPFYTHDPDGAKYNYPYARPDRGMQVVKKSSISNGIGGTIDTLYHYAGGKVDVSGRGFLGFDEIRETTSQRDHQILTRYHLNWPLTGMPAVRQETDAQGNLITGKIFDYAAHEDNLRFVYPESVIQVDYLLQSTAVSVKKVENRFDAYGGLEYQRTQVGSDFDAQGEILGRVKTTLVHNTLANDTTEWLLGFVSRSTTAVSTEALGWTIPSASETTDVWSHDYVAEPGTLDVQRKNTFVGTDVEQEVVTVRDGGGDGSALPGVVTRIERRARDLAGLWTARRIQVFNEFDAGLFPQAVTNEAQHTSRVSYDKRFGAVTKTVDSNGISTSTHYNLFGRASSSVDAVGVTTADLRMMCDAATAVTCPDAAVYLVVTRVNKDDGATLGAPLSLTFYDALQRPVRTQTYGLDGTAVKQDTAYDASGRLASVSEPFTGVSGDHFTTYSDYNALGEALTISQPDGGVITNRYDLENGWLRQTQTVAIADSMSTIEQVTERHLDPLGLLRRTVDAHDVVTDLTYDVQGRLAGTRVNGNAASEVSVTHDVAGNKIFIHDPATGPIRFRHNGFGEVREQTWQPGTPAAKSISYQYDALGRQTSRTDTASDGTSTGYSWVYDTLKKGYLTGESGNGVTRAYTYTAQGQVSTLTETITGAGAKTFTYTYDRFGRLRTQRYPDGLVVQQIYEADGVHAQTLDITDESAIRVLWAQGETLDAAGNYRYQWYGNGVATEYETDARSGRLTGITTGKVGTGTSLNTLVGSIQNLGFTWDSHGNLQSRSSARTNAAGTVQENLSESFTYDDLNRLDTATTRSGTATSHLSYDYDAHGNLTRNRLGALTYGQTNGASLYGVTQAGGNTYGYDAYGNATTLGSRTAQYDVFNKPTRIGNTQFVYGPNHEKVKTISGGTTTYHYAGGGYLEESSGSNLTSKAYVGGYYLRETTAGTTTERYLHFDHLGSVEAISDADGNFVTRMSFDAFGNRRNANWTTLAAPLPANTFATAWGFTGHDMVDAEGLVHMGGRVYDPTLGRFLSADLYVQAPDNSQSYNRYAYVINNPLSRVDPTGYQSCEPGEICGEITVTGRKRRDHDENSTLRGSSAMYLLRDMSFFNNDWQQMAHQSGGWSAPEGNGIVGYDAHGVPVFDESHPRFHHYYGSNSCAQGSGGCSYENAVAGLLRYPAPGASGKPVENGQTSLAIPVGKVRHVVIDGGSQVVNVTIPGSHVLHPGIVRRWVTQDARSVTIHTYGEGTGRLPRANEFFSDSLWRRVDNNIFDYMRQQQ
jgi:RHS repeat-associated protein